MDSSTAAPEDTAGPSSVSPPTATTGSLPPTSSAVGAGIPEADVQRIAQAVAAILKKPDAPSSSPLTSGPPTASAPPIGKHYYVSMGVL